MKNVSKTKQELIKEISSLKQRTQELEQAESERKLAEEALRESEEQYRTVLQTSMDGFWLVDMQGRLLEVNEAYCKMSGYNERELLSMRIPDLDVVETVDDTTARIEKIMAQGSDRFESRHRRKDGSIFEVETSVRYTPSKGGQVVAFLKDITEMNLKEAEKRKLEERLQYADKIDSVGILSGGIANDLNNLLMGIQGYASLTLLEFEPDHPNYQRLKRIEEQVQKGAHLTRQLLGFPHGERYVVKPTDINDILEKTSSLFSRTQEKISIHRKYGKDLWTVEVDQEQMEQVFMNIYVNAWQAMPGGGEICLETENVLLNDEQAFPNTIMPGKYVKITVTDTSAGMDEKTSDRIFGPFFTAKEMERGTSFGLTTVYRIVKGHKGTINVESEPGHGASFNIYLPASENEVEKVKMAAGIIAMGDETILLVDDEKMILEINKELLESMGYQVYAAGSGQEAIAVYMEKRNEIDLVILDMIMPEVSGGETFDRLREINPGIKVLLSSGYSIDGEAQEILDRGCTGFIQKPFSFIDISRKVREMLD
jgi:two-component system cell cycle sensor histidine kinase/response regulator CckA